MDSLDNTYEDALLKFHLDVLHWKSMIEFMEGEITFINRLLNSNAFETTHDKLFEKLHKFKHQIKTKTRELKNLKKIIDSHETKMRGIIECNELSCDTAYLNNHDTLKGHFEKFLKNFFEYKLRVYNYTGSILKHS